MAYSDVSICNQALIKIGAEEINVVGENSPAGRLTKAMYEPNRDAVLSLYPWKCARKRVRLARLEETPAWGFSYAYQLPTDYLTMYRTRDKKLVYEIEGRQLLTDAEEVYIIYIRKIIDPNLFSALLVEAMSSRLAQLFAVPIAHSKSLRQEMKDDFEKTIATARTEDAHGSTEDEQKDKEDSWLAARS